jgi:hypothetical protein
VIFSRRNRCHINAVLRYLCVDELRVAVNSAKLISITMETQLWVTRASVSNYRIFHSAVNSIVNSLCTVSDIFVRY